MFFLNINFYLYLKKNHNINKKTIKKRKKISKRIEKIKNL